MKNKIKPFTLVCAECGSPNVQIKMWVNPNTNEIGDGVSDGESDDNWCCDCERHPNLITYKEFKEDE